MRDLLEYIHFGDCCEVIGELLGGWGEEGEQQQQDVVYITDRNVRGLYPYIFEGQRTIVVESDERVAKSVWGYVEVVEQLLEMGAGRKTVLVGVGGGVVCDLVGFVGSTFFRGVRFGFVATTLLAQIDAAVGGKNGINISGYKNTVGCFKLPEFVIIDPRFLDTLPPEEILSARGEVVKYALLFDIEILSSPDFVRKCVEHKHRIVTNDMYETAGGDSQGGLNHQETETPQTESRKLLNLGHTIAHAIEHCTPDTPHGIAVGIGLCEIARISHRLGIMEERECQKIIKIIENEGLQSTIPMGISPTMLIDAIRKDKKHHQNTVELILLKGINRATTVSVSFVDLVNLLNG